MKLFHSPSVLCLFALIFSLSSITYAAGAKKQPTPPLKVTTVIQSISADSITVATGPKTTTYKITGATRYNYNGERVAPAELKSGMRVNVTPGGSDDKTAEEISATGAPRTAPKAAAPAKGAKGK